jgi:hypothetical protein
MARIATHLHKLMALTHHRRLLRLSQEEVVVEVLFVGVVVVQAALYTGPVTQCTQG